MTGKRRAGSALILITVMMAALLVHCRLFAGDCSSRRISVESASAGLPGAKEFILIDVRSAKEFEKFRISGSVNIPLFAIKTKTFPRSRPLVLVNEGHSYRELLDECGELSRSGFTVSILDGGLYQWKQKGGPIEGDVFAQRELNRLSPQMLLQGKGLENWTLIDVSPSTKSEPALQDLTAIRLPYSNNPEQFTSGLKAEIGRRDVTPFHSFLIYDEAGTTYEEMEKPIQKAGIGNVLYLKGGLEGYRALERQQIGIRQAKDEIKKEGTVKIRKRCATCP